MCEYQLKWTYTFDVISKSPAGIQYRNTRHGPLIPILPTLTCSFHQNTNLGLKKRIGVYFHLKYYHTLNPMRTFNQYHKKIFNFTQNYSLLTNLFNFTLWYCKLSFCKNIFNRACPPVYSHLCYFGIVYRKRK